MDVGPWLRSDAPTSPDRLFCHVHGRGKGNAQMIVGWLGNPGTFRHCLAARRRSTERSRLLELGTYTERYAAGFPVHHPAERQPHYPWWIAWRDQPLSGPTADLVDIALATSRRNGWLEPTTHGSAPVWLPPDGPLPVAPDDAGAPTGSQGSG